MNLENILNLGRKIIPKPIFKATQPAYHFILAVTGNLRYGFPARKMIIIGVTGTNGKSTTVELINSVLKANGKKTGMLSTVAFEIAGKRSENITSRTTLGRWQLQKKLADMLEAGCTHVVIEVSSEALSWHRLWGIPFDIAVFTNLSPEHLNFHKTMKDYREAKGRIFASLNHSLHKTTAKTIIVNADDKSAGYYYHFDAERKITYGLNNGEIWATNMYFDQFTEFELVDGDERYPVKTSLPAKFNIYNLLAAYTVGKALCFKPEKIIKGLEKVKQIEGRMQEVPNTRGVKIYVDYAMTPDAYENLFREARRVTKGKLIAVFGAAGDRDKTKRPLIGEVAAKMADYTIITEDEPYSEKTEKIIQEIEEGYKKIRENDYVIVLDRREALKRSISMAKTGDTIVIPGMGHERFRNIGGNKKIAWNEVQIIQELLEEINSTKK